MIMPAFRKFKREAAIIGRLLAGYGELEIDLLNCVAIAREDFDATLKAMFRTRSSSNRIDVADALGRQLYRKLKLAVEFEEAIGAVRHCSRIRNQYAHCNWYDDNSGALGFVNVEDLAKKNQNVSGFESLTPHYVGMALLEEQEQYFGYTMALLWHVNGEGRLRAGKLKPNPWGKPPYLKQPSLR